MAAVCQRSLVEMPRLYAKAAVRRVAAWAYHASRGYLARHRGEAMILMYHRVLRQQEKARRYVQPGMYVLEDVFDMQMRFLRQHFEVISMADLLGKWKSNSFDEGRRYCVITFDDGWYDNYEYAYPVLRKYNIPATIFLVTSLVGTKQWFWPERISYLLERCWNVSVTEDRRRSVVVLLRRYLGNWLLVRSGWSETADRRSYDAIDQVIEACKCLPPEEIDELIEKMRETLDVEFPAERAVLSWDEISEMSENGISFGSHSCTHRILTKLPFLEIKTEIEASNRALRERQINYVPVFCYPNGNYNREIQTLVRDCGYEAAVAARFGFEGESPQELFGINRIGVHNDISSTLPLFSLYLSGSFHREHNAQS